MDNKKNHTPKKSNPSSLEPNPSSVPVTTSSANSNNEGNNHPPSRSKKRKTSPFMITLINLTVILKLIRLHICIVEKIMLVILYLMG